MIVKFEYNREKLFTRIRLESEYIARNIKDEKGESQLDAFGITENDKPLIFIFMKTICSEIFKDWLSPLAKNYTSEDEQAHGQVMDAEAIQFVIKPDKRFDKNKVKPLDIDIEDAIVYYCLYKWLLESNYNHERAYFLYNKAIDGIKSVVSRLRYVRRYDYKF